MPFSKYVKKIKMNQDSKLFTVLAYHLKLLSYSLLVFAPQTLRHHIAQVVGKGNIVPGATSPRCLFHKFLKPGAVGQVVPEEIGKLAGIGKGERNVVAGDFAIKRDSLAAIEFANEFAGGHIEFHAHFTNRSSAIHKSLCPLVQSNVVIGTHVCSP